MRRWVSPFTHYQVLSVQASSSCESDLAHTWVCVCPQVPAAGMLLCFPLFHLPQFQGIRVAAVAVLLWTFGPAALVQTYLLQWPFMDEMKALQVAGVEVAAVTHTVCKAWRFPWAGNRPAGSDALPCPCPCRSASAHSISAPASWASSPPGSWT